MGACHRTSDGQERDMIFHLRVTESKAAISLSSFTVAGDFVLQVIRLESLGSELQES